MAITKRPLGFQSHLGSLDDEGVTAIGGTNDSRGGGPAITSQDVMSRGSKLTAFSAVNASNPSTQNSKLSAEDFPIHALDAETDIPHIEDNTHDDWEARGRDAYMVADSFYQGEIKPKLEDSIRAFNSEHRAGSIYTRSPAGWTSKLYKPKTRETMNKYQAACSVAFFSNQDVASIEAQNPFDIQETMAASYRKALIQYRLKRTIPWFLLCNGAFQDSMIQGVVIGHVSWNAKTRKPEIQIIPLDKVRFDPESDWMDPVNDSPYFIRLKEMTVGQYREEVRAGKFYEVDDNLFQQAIAGTTNDADAVRNQTKGGAAATVNSISDYQRIVIQEHIHRVDGEDHVFHMLGTIMRCSDVVPIAEAYLHGKRPFVLGYAEIESHRVFVAGIPQMLQGLQDELNEITNQRLNNVKLVMNKKIAYRSGSNIDLNALLRNQPGAAVPMENPKEDFVEISTPDVTQSAYLEQESLSRDFDALAGNLQTPGGLTNRQPEGGRTMQMLNSNVNVLVEYRLRTFASTFVTPMIILLDETERVYEHDPKVLELIARNVGMVRQAPVQPQESNMSPAPGGAPGAAGANPAPQGQGAPTPNPQAMTAHNPMPKPAEFTDEHLQYCFFLMSQDLNIDVNVGMNATDPMLKLSKLLAAINAMLEWLANPKSAMLDFEELAKEVFALSGYIDGMRFMKRDIDPVVMGLQQTIMQLQIQLKYKLEEKKLEGQNRLAAIGEKEKHADLRKAADLEHDSKRLVLDHAEEMQKHNNERVDAFQMHKDQMAASAAKDSAPAE